MAAPKTRTTISTRRETPADGAATEVTGAHEQPTTAAAAAVTVSGKKQKYLKSTRNGVVYLFTEALATRDDMVLCDVKGHPKFADEDVPFEALPLRDQIGALQTKEELVDFAAKHDMAFEKGTTTKDMRILLIKELCPKDKPTAAAADTEEDEAEEPKAPAAPAEPAAPAAGG